MLFGADRTPGVVAATLAADGRAVRLWLREGDALRTELVAFSPFLIAADAGLLGDAPGLVALRELDGVGALRWLARFGSWGEALGARDRCRDG